MRVRLISLVLLLVVVAGCTTGPVCNKPYILVGRDCCLDRNDNRICDSDEITTSTVVSTTSTNPTLAGTSSTFVAASTTSTFASVSTTKPGATSTTVTSTSTSTVASTTTSSTSTSTTSSTSTTTSTTIPEKVLPVSEEAFEEHIKESDEYMELLLTYGESSMVEGFGSRTYKEVEPLLEEFEKEKSLDCLDCIEFSGGLVWTVEFTARNASEGYMWVLDRENGTGVVYRINNRSKKITCWCDSI